MKPSRGFKGWMLAAASVAALSLVPAQGISAGAPGASRASGAPPPPASASAPAPGGPAVPRAPSPPTPPPAPRPTAAGASGAAEPPPQPGIYLGPTTCGSSSCHGSVTPRRALGVRQDEYFIWQKRDLHAQAFGVLFNDRSRVIARRLGIADPSASQVCVDCHGLSVPARQRRGPLELEDGVSCESCHGAASGWLEGHRSESWTHQQSVAAGMTDLRDVSVRSAVCLSCHLGAADKTVNHDLIAAGHPVLAFELDNYSEAMPAHWLPFGDRRSTAGERDTHGARAWAVGQAAAFRSALDQLARRARAGGDRWPEFAELSCDACHHSLAQERWRTARPAALPGEPARPGRPGLPRFSLAHYAVLRHLVAVAAPERQAALDAGVDRLAGQLGRFDTPPAEVAAAAEQLSREAADLVPRLDRMRWDDAQARRLLLALALDEGGLEVADYYSAQQAALAVQTLVSQLLAGDPRRLHAGLAAAAEGLAAELQNPYDFNASRFADRLAQLGRQLQPAP
jgi:hypothetical protein